MVKVIKAKEDYKIPEGVSVKANGRKVTVTGARGSVTKDFGHLKMDIKLVQKKVKGALGNYVEAELWHGNRAGLACIKTVLSHIKNMCIGVTKGFLYKMRLVYSHFPINVEEENGKIVIKHFLGELRNRYVDMPKGVKMEKSSVKDELIFSGVDVQDVSQVCANIHTATLVRNKDIRKFLDGVYVSSRGFIDEDS